MPVRQLATLLLALTTAGATPPGPVRSPRSSAAPTGEAVIRAAYARYAGKWFRTATYVQRVTQSGQVETWYNALQLPGLLRIDVAPALSGRALIYHGDSIYQIARGRIRQTSVEPSYLFILLEDLHTEAPERTIARLRPIFNLSRTHETVWQGRPVIVVGALAGDTVSNQFWLDKERLIVVRLIQPNGMNPRAPLDARVQGYQPLGGGWMEQQVEIRLGGQVTQTRDYHNARTGMRFEPGMFKPMPYRLPAWVGDLPDLYGNSPGLTIPH